MSKVFSTKEGQSRSPETSVLATLSAEERELSDLAFSPAAWGESFLTNRDGQPRRYRAYQREDLDCDAPRVVHMDGRAVGKTVDLATLVLWFAFTHPGKSVLVAAPYQGHLDTIIEEVEEDRQGRRDGPHQHSRASEPGCGQHERPLARPPELDPTRVPAPGE